MFFFRLFKSLAFLGCTLLAAVGKLRGEEAKSVTVVHGGSVFASNYLSTGFAHNTPAGTSNQRFEQGHAHPIFGYRFVSSNGWAMGAFGQYKFLNRRYANGEPHPGGTTRDLPIFTFIHDARYYTHLSFPFHIGIGPKIYYLLPTKSARLPMQRDDEYRSGIGAGLGISIAFVNTKKNIWEVNLDRWRGTYSQVLQGHEISLTFSQSLF